jgi:hypothetical protein
MDVALVKADPRTQRATQHDGLRARPRCGCSQGSPARDDADFLSKIGLARAT